MGGFSLWHILIFAVIVLLLFGGTTTPRMSQWMRLKPPMKITPK